MSRGWDTARLITMLLDIVQNLDEYTECEYSPTVLLKNVYFKTNLIWKLFTNMTLFLRI